MSENFFTDLYNKILGLFGQSEQKEDSKDVAVNRLRVVLMQDRTNLSPELLERMRRELVELLSRYVEMDKEALELNFEQEGEQMALMLSIPVVRAKDEKEIEAALKAEDEKKAAEEAKDSEKEGDNEDEEISEEENDDDETEEDDEDVSEEENIIIEEDNSDDDNDEDAAEEEEEISDESKSETGEKKESSKEDE